MTCTITQDSLGPMFEDVAAELAALFIAQATIIVLGAAGQAAKEAAYIGCGVDPCNMIVLLTQHLLTVTPGAGAESGSTVESQTVGRVSVSYGTATSASGLFAGSAFGTMYQFELAKFEKCQSRRRTLPRSIGPSGAPIF